jgi:hypothetical protein
VDATCTRDLTSHRFTPRKHHHDGGPAQQTDLREPIAEAMRHEMLVCTADDFLEHLAPFTPDDGWVESALDHLKAKGLLGPPPRTCTAFVPKRRTTRTSARVRAEAVVEVGPPEPEVNPQVCVPTTYVRSQ